MKTNRIKILSPGTVSKIAAGEVIDRPSSVLKELLENSLDADAKTINIDFSASGKELIRVNDDGSGVLADDIELSIKRHSTSKISDFSDLDKLNTFGFRGEALYSIAAVSKLTIKSLANKSNLAREIYAEGGKILKNSPAGHSQGTTVEVKDLFYNLPARKKFLKTDATERSRIIKTFEEYALSNTDVGFYIRSEGSEIYSLPAPKGDERKKLHSRIKSVYGEEISDNLNYVSDRFMDVKGFIGSINRFSTSKTIQFFFVNKRPVTSLVLVQALYRAMSSYLDRNSRAVSFIHFDLKPDTFDINIHPQKREIRFKDEGLIFSLVSRLVAQAMGAGFSAEEEKNTAVYYIRDKERPVERSLEIDSSIQPHSQHKAQDEMFKPFYRFLGQISQSYLLFETEKSLLVLDQHAAAERVLFEKYLGELDSKPQVQEFIVPVTVDITASQMENLMSNGNWLKNVGFEIERFGSNTISVVGTPVVFGFDDNQIKEFIFSLSQELSDAKEESETIRRQRLARLACKKSVKARRDITREEAVALLKNLHNCKHPNICPHGRPISFELGKSEISKKLGRGKVL